MTRSADDLAEIQGFYRGISSGESRLERNRPHDERHLRLLIEIPLKSRFKVEGATFPGACVREHRGEFGSGLLD